MPLEVNIRIKRRPWGNLNTMFPSLKDKFPKMRRDSMKRLGLALEKKMKEIIKTGDNGRFKPLSPMSVETRTIKANTPLFDTGLLFKSITSQITADGKEVRVGVDGSARTKEGVPVSLIATLQDRGVRPFNIPVNRGVRRFFYGLSKRTGGKFKAIARKKKTIRHPGIPARKFISRTASTGNLKPFRNLVSQYFRDQLSVTSRLTNTTFLNDDFLE
jgi:hypothetical protein